VSRAAAGLIALDCGFLVTGLAVLWALGFVGGARDAVRHAPLALVTGWVTTALLATLVLLVGPMPTASETVALWGLALGAAALGLLRRRPPDEPVPAPPPRETSRAGATVAAAGALVVAAVVAADCRRALASGPLSPDVVTEWLPKAETLFYFGRIDSRPGGFLSFSFEDYPPLAYVSDGLSFRFMGRADPLLIPTQHWVLAAAFYLSVAVLLSSRVRAALVWPGVALLAVLPRMDVLVGSALADEPLTELFALTAICLVLWMLGGVRRYAWLAVLLGAGVVLVKAEGSMLMLTLALAPAAWALRRRRLRDALLPLSPLLAAAAWRVWLAVHHVRRTGPDYRLVDFFHPGYLASRTGRLEYAARELADATFSPKHSLLLAAATLALAPLLAFHRRAIAVLLVSVVVVPTLVYLGIYWIGFDEIHLYLDGTKERLTAPIDAAGAVLLPLLVTEAWRSWGAGAGLHSARWRSRASAS